MPIIIAGPCVIEHPEIMDEIAETISRINQSKGTNIIFKASFDKANRTSVSSYRGPGIDNGLTILSDIKSKYGLQITTDIHEAWQAHPVAEVADIIQIPALLCRQTDLISSAAQTGKALNIKKGQFLSGEDMKHVIAKAREYGSASVFATERGNSFGYNNTVIDFRNIPIMRQFADAVIMDCTHAVQTPGTGNGFSEGNPEHIRPMAMAAKAFGADGYFFEVHPSPSNAMSDATCSLELSLLENIISDVIS
jgi:2-dehydro-3-deoxyphosphooctonate aldolase (KDO 8-P synthase)